MIASNSRDVFALLANDRACQWPGAFRCPSPEALSKLKPLIIDNDIAFVHDSHPEVNIFVTVTLDNSILVYSKLKSGPADITSAIHQVIDNPNETIQSVRLLSYSSNVVQMVAITERSVTVFDIRYMGLIGKFRCTPRPHGVIIQSASSLSHQSCCFEVALMIRHIFPAAINLVGIGDHEGTVRTTDNKLYHFRTSRSFYKKPITKKRPIDEFKSVDMPDIQSIQKIVYCSNWAHLIMGNGIVNRMHGGWWTHTDASFKQITLPRRTRVAAVVIGNDHVFYVTAGGPCYYGYTFEGPNGATNHGLNPLHIQTLKDYDVEHVFVTPGHVFFKYASEPHSKLGVMFLNGPRRGLDSAYINGTKALDLLPYFDNMCIVSVIPALARTYFVTSDGSMHMHMQSFDNPNAPHELCIHEIPFFKQNPIKVENANI